MSPPTAHLHSKHSLSCPFFTWGLHKTKRARFFLPLYTTRGRRHREVKWFAQGHTALEWQTRVEPRSSCLIFISYTVCSQEVTGWNNFAWRIVEEKINIWPTEIIIKPWPIHQWNTLQPVKMMALKRVWWQECVHALMWSDATPCTQFDYWKIYVKILRENISRWWLWGSGIISIIFPLSFYYLSVFFQTSKIHSSFITGKNIPFYILV